MGQGRLQAHGFVGVDQAAVAAQGLHLLGGLESALELAGVRVEVQDALHALLVLDAGVRPQLLQGLAAVGAQANDLPDALSRWALRSSSELDRARTEQSFCVPKDDIVAQGYDLSLNRYKEIVHDEVEHRPPLEIIAEIEKLESEIAAGLAELKAMLS